MEGFARLEVERAVLHLHDDIVAKLPVERDELAIGLLHAVSRFFRRIDKGAPHHDAAMGFERIGQHVRALGVAPSIVLRAGLAFGVRLHEKAAKVGDHCIDCVGFLLPPGLHGHFLRICRRKAVQLHRSGEARREIDLYAIGPQHIGEGGDLLKIVRCQGRRIGIHIGERDAVDSYRRIGAGIVLVARIDVAWQEVPVPDRLTRIATLDMPVQIVPMVQQAKPDSGRLLYRHHPDIFTA